ncbi:MAG: sigma-70 family RNA polymerase sigma factor [Deltaproteobacteria bacterium]|nr:sigma-70 family RNA polymerase sigma factor [Deltaproteobacteria bacterium]
MSDADLVRSAREGESWALEALYKRHARMVNGMAWRLMPHDPEVEDLVQDVFILAFDRLSRLENPGAFRSWIGGITIRQAHKKLRRRGLRQRLGLARSEAVDLDRLISPSTPPDAAAELRAVYGIVDQLPAQERVALILRRVEALPLGEIAEQMGISLATVKRRLSAAETRLQENLARVPRHSAKGGRYD